MDFDEMTVAELKAKCKAKGLSYNNLHKGELVEKLTASTMDQECERLTPQEVEDTLAWIGDERWRTAHRVARNKAKSRRRALRRAGFQAGF